MIKNVVLVNLKKRKSAEAIDFFLSIFFMGLFAFLGIINGYLGGISPFIALFLYFGIFPYYTKGSTLGGLIFGIRIVFFDKNNKKILPNPFIYLKRFFFFLNSNRSYLGLMLASYKINSNGQLDMDERCNSTVLSKDLIIDFSEKITYYVFEVHKDNLYEQSKRIGVIFKRVMLFLIFGPIFLAMILHKIFS